jgi:protein-tyrosine-phosphatase
MNRENIRRSEMAEANAKLESEDELRIRAVEWPALGRAARIHIAENMRELRELSRAQKRGAQVTEPLGNKADWMRFSIWGVVSSIGQSTKDEPDTLLIRV